MSGARAAFWRLVDKGKAAQTRVPREDASVGLCARPEVLSPFRSARPGFLQRECACGGTPGLAGECAECRKKRLTLQRRSDGQAEPNVVPPIVHEALRLPGQPLGATTRASMEPRFGHDFSKVRVHADAKAAESARAVNALAYTVGRDVVFRMGQYTPGAREGRKLLAHELTHVVQQGNATESSSEPLTVGDAWDGWEDEAERMAMAVSTMRHSPNEARISSMPTRRVQRRDPDAPFPASPPSSPSSTARTYSCSITTSGCHEAPYVRATVVAAARAAFDKVLSSTCVGGSLKDEILSEFDGLNIDCEQGDEDSPCGMAHRYFTQTVNIYPPALDLSTCGSLASTILHEVVHLTEWRLFGHGELADACEASCFGYGSGDPTKCK